MAYCHYYQATVARTTCCTFVSIMRSFDHLVFDRTCDCTHHIFEFFVPPDNETDFLTIMKIMQQHGWANNVCKLPNRLMDT